MGRTFNLMVRTLGLSKLHDTQCGFKLFPGRLANALAAVQRLDGYTITHFTPGDTVRALTKRLGFKELSKQVRILLPHFLSRGRSGSGNSMLCYDPQDIEDTLTEFDKGLSQSMFMVKRNKRK